MKLLIIAGLTLWFAFLWWVHTKTIWGAALLMAISIDIFMRFVVFAVNHAIEQNNVH